VTTTLTERPATLPGLITFTAPIPGFPAERDFDVCPLDAHGVLYALRSRQTPGLRFVVAVPARFFPEYRPALMPADVAALGVSDGDEVLVLVVVTVTDSIADATANLLAPIVIAAGTGAAVQLVLADNDLPLRAPLLSSAS
jgi:flagellar assembly factor FliW